jgi:hypothetical protein
LAEDYPRRAGHGRSIDAATHRDGVTTSGDWVAVGARPRCPGDRGGWGEANSATNLAAGGQMGVTYGDGRARP